MKFNEARGSIVGAVVVGDDDEVFSIKASGGVTRVSVGEVNPTGRVTMGVRFISLADDDTVVAIARNAERAAVEDESDEDLVEQSEESEEPAQHDGREAEVPGGPVPDDADGTRPVTHARGEALRAPQSPARESSGHPPRCLL